MTVETPRRRNGDLKDRVLVFAHIGDLHITDAKQRNFTDFLSIVAQIEIECAKLIDFVVLPGDNADNGLPSQYALVTTGLKMLSRPVHAIPGDHDMAQGGLAAFYSGLQAAALPAAKPLRGVRCLFLDICGAGDGGPDFRAGTDQVLWLERELRSARARGETSVIFMHSYPDDLKGDGETAALNRLIAAHDVALVDMGHTHYNELANDGRTIFAATRSTGQIEEGPVGYSIASVDGGGGQLAFQGARRSVPVRGDHIAGGSPFGARSGPGGRRHLRGTRAGVRSEGNRQRPLLGRRRLDADGAGAGRKGLGGARQGAFRKTGYPYRPGRR